MIRAALVNPFDLGQEVGRLAVSGGTLSWSYYSETKAGGSVEVEDASAIGNNLVRIYDGERALGTYFATVPEVDWTNGMRAATVELSSTLVRLRDDCLPWQLAIPAGTNAIESADSVLDHDMEPYMVSGETDEQQAAAIPSDLVLECGTSRLTQANAALTAAGHESLGVEPYGKAVIGWYYNPSERQPKFALSGLEVGSRITVERDTDCPSAVYYVTGEDGAETIGSAELDPANPLHWSQTGRRITEVYRPQDEATQAELSAMAARSLAQKAARSDKATVQHRLAPISVGDVGTVEAGPLSGRWMVLNIDLDLQTGICSTVLGRIDV